ncbi:MAG: preprotein translocase subunit SecY [Bacillota bacterium]|nr:preprotein translocase subunit SecY [Bacillota bacterium]HOB91636.1 preprotein translocase subunit SecY [Bacillota bacterium]HPZ54446.1 preprotein translocase subunit SecY [Bacillota bacterium]HQD17782.1 preprotein translocase subunit SecY [Bacillota bacterium]
MLAALASAFRIPDLRKRILYTVGLLAVYRIGSFIPVPGINSAVMEQLIQGHGVFGLMDMFSGGNLSRLTIFALNVGPYITAQIVMQLLTMVIPKLEELAKEGEEGRRQIQQYTRYGTILLAVIQGLAYTLWGRTAGALENTGAFTVVLVVTVLTAGTAFVMWLGEKISEHGIGNGISLIIFVGIVARIPSGARTAVQLLGGQGGYSIFSVVLFAIIALAVIVAVVAIQEGERRIPVQYAKRVVGRRMYGGQSRYLPLKVNQAGVIPVIFASSVLAFPATIISFVPALQRLAKYFEGGALFYNIVYVLLIIFFTYFYTAAQFQPIEIANNLKKYGGFIPGLRPGRPTAEYLDRVMTRITLAGALFLAFIAVLPNIMSRITGLPIHFGGTGLLIMVGVALDTMKQIETQLLMRQYQGFLK